MIQANELRIGNYIKYQDNLNFIVELEDFSDLYLGEDDIEDYHPILITQQRLIDLGFEDIGTYEYQINDDLIMENEYTDKGSWNFFYDNIHLTEIKHIHQLQNLYFAITGKELIKQKPASIR